MGQYVPFATIQEAEAEAAVAVEDLKLSTTAALELMKNISDQLAALDRALAKYPAGAARDRALNQSKELRRTLTATVKKFTAQVE